MNSPNKMKPISLLKKLKLIIQFLTRVFFCCFLFRKSKNMSGFILFVCKIMWWPINMLKIRSFSVKIFHWPKVSYNIDATLDEMFLPFVG